MICRLLSVGTLIAVCATAPAADPPKSAIKPPTAEEREKLLKAGGNSESQAAVARGLAWLARQQQKDGSWNFDGKSSDQVAAYARRFAWGPSVELQLAEFRRIARTWVA